MGYARTSAVEQVVDLLGAVALLEGKRMARSQPRLGGSIALRAMAWSFGQQGGRRSHPTLRRHAGR